MSEVPPVDLSQIRGDWHFHLNYLANAVHQTLKRAVKLWDEVRSEADAPTIGELVSGLATSWKKLEAAASGQNPIDVSSPLLDEFLALSGDSKGPCDALEDARGLGGSASIYDTPLEQFTEAMRQVRGFADDLVMMREQQP